MGKVRSIEYDGGIKTKYIQESNGALTINNSQDVTPLLKRNKELYNHDKGYLTSAKEMKRVASIPPLILAIWTKNTMELTTGFNYPKIFKEK